MGERRCVRPRQSNRVGKEGGGGEGGMEGKGGLHGVCLSKVSNVAWCLGEMTRVTRYAIRMQYQGPRRADK